jgi:hypothetical protein
VKKVRRRARAQIPAWGRGTVVHIDPRYLVGFEGYECGCGICLPPEFVCIGCGLCAVCCRCLDEELEGLLAV